MKTQAHQTVLHPLHTGRDESFTALHGLLPPSLWKYIKSVSTGCLTKLHLKVNGVNISLM